MKVTQKCYELQLNTVLVISLEKRFTSNASFRDRFRVIVTQHNFNHRQGTSHFTNHHLVTFNTKYPVTMKLSQKYKVNEADNTENA